MSYLNNLTITADSILTKKGRELLAKGRNAFKITKFALGDSEVDYNLWNVSHPMGTDYYGVAIESLPVLEAVPDESQGMTSKLVTLSKNTTRIPVIDVTPSYITLTSPGQIALIQPSTLNYQNGNATLGYTAILSNTDAAYIQPLSGQEVTNFAPVQDNSSPTTYAVAGKAFEVKAKPQAYEDIRATITIIGNETGGRKVVELVVKKTETATINTNTNTSTL